MSPYDTASPAPTATAAGRSQGLAANRSPARWREFWPDVLSFVGALLVACMAALALGSLSGCGGSGGVGTEGTGSYSAGPISGFGSIVVNGVHYDESSAAVADADDGGLDRSRLALGMVVEVTAGPVTTDASGRQRATATAVRAVRALRGPVTAAPDANGLLRVVGQAVLLQADTVYDSRIGSAAGLVNGRLVEVFGSFDPSVAAWRATRVALSDDTAEYCVRGTVTSVSNGSFVLNGQTFSLTGLANPGAVTVGAFLKVELEGRTDAQGRWLVSGQSEQRGPGGGGDQADMKLQGLIASISGKRWVVDGTTVDVSAVTVTGTPQVGARAEVSGPLRSGVLMATQAKVSASAEARTFEVEGTVVSRDTVARTFVVRSDDSTRLTTVSYAGSGIEYKDGASAAALATWAGRIDVRGTWGAGGVLLASRIEFDN